MATTANEPYAAIQARLTSSSELRAALTGGIKQQFPAGNPAYPLLVWKSLAQGVGDVDSDRDQYRDERIQIDLYGGDRNLLTDMAALVDSLFNDAILGNVIDTEHWRITLMARNTPWQDIPYQVAQDQQGNAITQRTSDWRFKALRKQAVI